MSKCYHLCWLLLALMAHAVAEPQLLRPEQAFQIAVDRGADDRQSVVVTATIADGYYLYHDKFAVTASGADIGELTLPPAQLKDDRFFGNVLVYRNGFTATAPLTAVTDDVSVTVHYQGCADIGLCYPPQTKTVSLRDATFAGDAAGRIAHFIDGHAPLLVLAAFFGFGLLLAFTPCVLPTLPVVLGIVCANNHSLPLSRAARLVRVGVYVLSLAAAYAVAGALAASLGYGMQAWLQRPLVIAVISAALVLLALAMFDVWRLPALTGWRGWVTRVTTRRGGGIVAAALLGVGSALMVGACVAPPLIGALLYIAQRGDMLFGGLALFMLGLGMGVPLLLLAMTTAALLPRHRALMRAAQTGLGVALIVTAIWLLDRIVPPVVTVVLLAIVAIAVAIALGIFAPLRRDKQSLFTILRRVLGWLLFVYGLALFVGALTGHSSLTRPLAGFAGSTAIVDDTVFTTVTDVTTLQTVLTTAAAEGTPLLLYITADWCLTCVELEAVTFRDAAVLAALDGWRRVRFDISDENEDTRRFMRERDIFGPPTLLFFARGGDEIRAARIIGYVAPQTFMAQLTFTVP